MLVYMYVGRGAGLGRFHCICLHTSLSECRTVCYREVFIILGGFGRSMLKEDPQYVRTYVQSNFGSKYSWVVSTPG